MKGLTTALLLLALVYLGICALLYVKQRDLIYFPAATLVPADSTNFSLVANGIVLRGWKLNPGQSRALIYFGGNAERLERSRSELASLFPDRTVYLLAYRGYGASEGKPSEAALLADSIALFDQVSAEHDQDIAVIGRSLGSGVASHLASLRPVSRLALVTPFDSLAGVAQAHYRWLPVRWLISDRYDTHRYLQHYAGPLLILRAGRDEVIPPANTDLLLDSLKGSPRVVEFAGADHNGISAEAGYGEALRDFMH
ncbi:MAG: alpha/beta hydrolase [Pseudoxanthomonas sp.]